MKIITWNINSVRLRIKHLQTLLMQHKPDIICLQETKVANEFFPIDDLKSIGFTDIKFSGQKSYNGVAILSTQNIKDHLKLKFINDDARHISAIIDNDIELHNFYIPSGGEEPDPKINSKFAHKLDYCDALETWILKNKTKNDKIILVGDLNIAPLEHDVWSHKQLINVISHTPIEIEKLNKINKSLDFIDVSRKFVPHNEKLYSWWSYRSPDWKKSNRGRRLDHIWTSSNLNNRIKNSYIISEARGWELPSDHVPVVIEIE
jgi:exodeoxyribonuclease-3